MTPSELREWAAENKLLTTRSSDAIASKLLLKLTDPTPITPEFAERVNYLRGVDLSGLGDDWLLVIAWDASESEIHVETIGQVNTLLWLADLLEQMDGE